MSAEFAQQVAVVKAQSKIIGGKILFFLFFRENKTCHFICLADNSH